MDVVNTPASRKGIAKPAVYTPISTNPAALLFAEAAMRSTLESVGPTQGVHAKLKTKPMISAVSGDIAILSTCTGSLFSLIKTEDVPKTPS